METHGQPLFIADNNLVRFLRTPLLCDDPSAHHFGFQGYYFIGPLSIHFRGS